MNSYLEKWKTVAGSLFPQALAGAPAFAPSLPEPAPADAIGFTATLSGEVTGSFSVVLDPALFETALVGEGMDQRAGWLELLREVAESAAGELLAAAQLSCRVTSFEETPVRGEVTEVFAIDAGSGSWRVWLFDATAHQRPDEAENASVVNPAAPMDNAPCLEPRPGIDLLLDIELEATVRFGCRELPLGEILDLGPGDVVELDRRVSDPVDLIVGDKIVAQGEVVLINGSFGLRVTSVAEPQKRLESIRCLF